MTRKYFFVVQVEGPEERGGWQELWFKVKEAVEDNEKKSDAAKFYGAFAQIDIPKLQENSEKWLAMLGGTDEKKSIHELRNVIEIIERLKKLIEEYEKVGLLVIPTEKLKQKILGEGND